MTSQLCSTEERMTWGWVNHGGVDIFKDELQDGCRSFADLIWCIFCRCVCLQWLWKRKWNGHFWPVHFLSHKHFFSTITSSSWSRTSRTRRFINATLQGMKAFELLKLTDSEEGMWNREPLIELTDGRRNSGSLHSLRGVYKTPFATKNKTIYTIMAV